LRNQIASYLQEMTMLPSALTRAGLKARGAGAIFTGGPRNVFHDVIVCNIYVFADSQRSPLLFPVVDYVPAVLTRL